MLKFETKTSNERKKGANQAKGKSRSIFVVSEKTQLMNNLQSDPCFACCNKYLYFYTAQMNNFQFMKCFKRTL